MIRGKSVPLVRWNGSMKIRQRWALVFGGAGMFIAVVGAIWYPPPKR